MPRRLAEADPTLWRRESREDVAARLGWLELPWTGEETLGDWLGFAAAERAAGIERVVLLGMGGSSLAPEVFERTLGEGEPSVEVLDSTHPEAVRRVADDVELERTLFVVSSKSGSTVETRSLFDYFWQAAAELPDPGRQFVAITDPGSPLEKLAGERRLHRVFLAPPEVGGRYSALSPFGLVPASLAGIDIRALVGRGRRAAEALTASWARAIGFVELGAVLGELALAGVDKLTLVASESLASFPDWIEQLVAESTGKEGLGILPVVGESLEEAHRWSDDRLFVGLLLDDDGDESLAAALAGLAEAGRPVIVTRLRDRLDLGFEMLRWEVGVALAGSVVGIDPFSQPDVERAKSLARGMMAGETEVRAALDSLERWTLAEATATALKDWLGAAATATYLSVCAFLPGDVETKARLSRLQRALGRQVGRPVTVGIGPRFLHSTGQLHKGGPSGARFLQLVSPAERDLPIPGGEATFGRLIAAQADGDAAALLERGQEVLRIELATSGDLEKVVRRVEDLG